ncbi:Flp pilus assembly protein CpaB [Herbaspirillum sp. ST 5-3]|uniref:Flp pilus assembly protein CpaB n=1 Tax=Oxalobacteraceae TaxID=75682 RepID=UPI0010A34034|nr:Flp pilus assembly protein CpaB [Herbaspirillum sp. ST 5-3]
MKNTRAIIMIGVSILAAIAAVLFASQWISEKAGLSTNKVVVAATDINLGTRLTPDMIRLVDWPAGSLPTGSANDLKKIDTRVARVSLQRGEPVLESKLAPVGTKGGLSAVVAEGKRAMTVRVNDVVGVAGFALPGNYVDILVSTQSENKDKSSGRDNNISKIVLEHILVLAVAQEASRDETKPKVVNAVTLEVTPEEAEKLDLARSVGQLSLALRNQIDPTPAQTDGATKQSLLNPVAYTPQANAPAPKPASVKKVRAAKRATAPKPSAHKEQCQEVITGDGRITQCYQLQE